ncbi:unnamed protein product, partial [Brassica rapa subsp. narinosa]
NKWLPPSCPHASKNGSQLRDCQKRYKQHKPEHFSTSSQPDEHTSQQFARHTRSRHETSDPAIVRDQSYLSLRTWRAYCWGWTFPFN